MTKKNMVFCISLFFKLESIEKRGITQQKKQLSEVSSNEKSHIALFVSISLTAGSYLPDIGRSFILRSPCRHFGAIRVKLRQNCKRQALKISLRPQHAKEDL